MTAVTTMARRRRFSTLATTAVAAGSVALSMVAIGTAAPATAKSVAKPKAPTALTATSGSHGLWLTWHHSDATATNYIVEQATNTSFSAGLVKYTTRGFQKIFTPPKVAVGTTYYFRVKAVNETKSSKFSKVASATDKAPFSDIRVLAYNIRSESLDAQPDKGGPSAPWSKRLPGVASLIKQGNADVVGIEEAGSCIHSNPGAPCTRQIDQLDAALRPDGYAYLNDVYRNANTHNPPDLFVANYILYKPATIKPIGQGGYWNIGPSNNERFGIFQRFEVRATGATFLYIDTHTLATAGHSFDIERGKEVKSLVAQGKAYASAHGISNVFYVGDFNSYPREYDVDDVSGNVMRNAGFPDGYEEAASYSDAQYDSINAYYRTAKHGHGSSDHIYATRGIGIAKWGELIHLTHGKFVGVIPSDHNPIYADVEIPY